MCPCGTIFLPEVALKKKLFLKVVLKRKQVLGASQ
jgi:hypothetical protein